ncbi:MAG: hypothetical protein IKV19_00205 [Bacteroidaceae bacterium]|nr:hypothetical protein [Bacteroidaceae bacterium]
MKRDKNEKKAERWEVCKVRGWISAVDPGCVSSECYPKVYNRDELWKGQNLSAHNEYLPSVVLKEIAEDHIVLFAGGQRHTIYTGETYTTPRKGLSYAYSEVDVRIDVE